jgi:hypothetical protein
MRLGAFLGLCLAAGFASQANSFPLFIDDFEDGVLSDSWVDDGNAVSAGQIVADPLQTDDALSFTGTDIAGDLFTGNGFVSATGQFEVAFDYLGLETTGSDDTDNLLGGFIGYSYGFPGVHYWLAGTNELYTNDIGQVIYENGTLKANDLLVDSGEWIHYEIHFTALPNTPIHLMFEDFHYIDMGTGFGGDAYFDNVTLSAIPEPPTAALIGLGLVGLAGLGRGSTISGPRGGRRNEPNSAVTVARDENRRQRS